MKILFLSRWFPYPADNGSKLRIRNLLKTLKQDHEVTLLSFTANPGADLDEPEVRRLCSDIHVVPWREFDPQSVKAKSGFFSLTPRSIIDTFSPEMAMEITRILDEEKYDLVIASQLPMAAYYRYFTGVPAVFEELELGLAYGEFRQASGLKNKLRRSLTWLKLKGYLSRLLRHFQGVTVVSGKERDLVAGIFPEVRNLLVTPNCIDLNAYRSAHSDVHKDRLIFTGSFRYQANYEAMRWFSGEVFPLILRRRPDVELVITGDHAGLRLPWEKGIKLSGQVEDIQEMLACSTIAIAPLQSGGGTRLKILEAMALGVPVVATSKGAEGLEARGGEHLLIADNPEDFADCIISLLGNEAFRCQLAEQARLLVRERYDWSAAAPEFLRFIGSLSGTL